MTKNHLWLRADAKRHGVEMAPDREERIIPNTSLLDVMLPHSNTPHIPGGGGTYKFGRQLP